MARARNNHPWEDLPLFRQGASATTMATEASSSEPGKQRPGDTGNRTGKGSGVGNPAHAPASRSSLPTVQLPDWSHLPPLPPGIRFGTSSWTYPGWFGQVYSRKYRPSGDTLPMLEEYVQCPLFQCVGIDSTFYRPPTRETLEAYAATFPPGFVAVAKVYERFTIRRFARHPKWGTLAGERNPDFLDAQQCTDLVVGPWLEVLGEHAGPLIFEFQAMNPPDRPAPEAWAEELEHFFQRLPSIGKYAVEIRNPQLLHPAYLNALKRIGVSHVFNAWTRMPPILEQRRRMGGLPTDFIVVRGLLQTSRTYAAAVDRFKPYDRIQDPQHSVRAEIVRMVLDALATGRTAFILINNRLEGNAPGTIEAIRSLLARALASVATASDGETT